MSLNRFFTQEFELFEESSENVQGVIKDSKISYGKIKGILDKAITKNVFTADKDTFVYTNTLFTDINSEVIEGRVISWRNNEYDIIAVIDPLYREHHLEVLLSMRK